jgi:hypothetical protein
VLALLETGDHVHTHLPEPDKTKFHGSTFLAHQGALSTLCDHLFDL